MDLNASVRYHSCEQEARFLSIPIHSRLSTMKLAIRIFALSVVIAGVTAAAVTPKNTPVVANHLSATASQPIPLCGPHMGCSAKPNPNK